MKEKYEEYWIKWCEDRTRFYKAWGEALEIIGPILARKENEKYLKLFEEEEKNNSG